MREKAGGGEGDSPGAQGRQFPKVRVATYGPWAEGSGEVNADWIH